MIRMVAVTRKGTREKIENQDRIVVNDKVLASEGQRPSFSTLDERSLVAVLDGMGGHAGGGVASAVAADVVASGYGGIDSEDGVAQLVETANQRLYAMMQSVPSLTFMGSTIAGVLFGPGEMTIFNVGDSRVYLHTGGYLLQASRDHSSPRGELVQSLGGLDTHVPVETHMTTEPLGNGKILLATDGLFRGVSSEVLARAVSKPLRKAGADLLQLAVDSGNDDDISFIVIEMWGYEGTEPDGGRESEDVKGDSTRRNRGLRGMGRRYISSILRNPREWDRGRPGSRIG